MEVLKLKTSSGIAKLIGIAACIGGAATLAFFKGPHFKVLCHHQIFGSYHSQEVAQHVSSGKTWIKGCFLMLMSNTLWGLWLVLQVTYSFLMLTVQLTLTGVQTQNLLVSEMTSISMK